METPPRDKKATALHARHLQARLKTEMEREMDVDLQHPSQQHPEMERMDDVLVHSGALKPVDDDLDDEDLD
ncbi:hypothetical protein ATCC90586_006358 [Pythium insidiosum]|nr:hypothetical protein ATCC90586_006358 [Pythium insidiosum]